MMHRLNVFAGLLGRFRTLGFGSSELVSRIVCGERDHSMPIRMDPYSPNRFA